MREFTKQFQISTSETFMKRSWKTCREHFELLAMQGRNTDQTSQTEDKITEEQ